MVSWHVAVWSSGIRWQQSLAFVTTMSQAVTRGSSDHGYPWGEFLRLLFLQAHRETEASFNFMGMPAQPQQADQFRFRRAAFYSALKSQVDLIAAKAAALRVNMDADSCMVASPAASRHTQSHAHALFHSSLTHTLPRPRGAWGGH